MSSLLEIGLAAGKSCAKAPVNPMAPTFVKVVEFFKDKERGDYFSAREVGEAIDADYRTVLLHLRRNEKMFLRTEELYNHNRRFLWSKR